jgi:hypothetical protein
LFQPLPAHLLNWGRADVDHRPSGSDVDPAQISFQVEEPVVGQGVDHPALLP